MLPLALLRGGQGHPVVRPALIFARIARFRFFPPVSLSLSLSLSHPVSPVEPSLAISRNLYCSWLN